MSCNCAESTAVADRRDAYEDFVKKQLDALRQSLLRRYDTELLHGYGHVVRDDEVQVGKRHVVSVTVDDRLRGVPPLERSHEDSEDAFFYPRWIELTAKMLQMKDNDEGNSQDDFTENDLHMLPMWNISLQDLKRRTRPRNFRTMFTHDKKGNLKMKDTIREELSCLHRMVLQPNSWQQLLWTAIGATLILWDLITIPLGFFSSALPTFLDFLRIFSRFTFAYWVTDMPLHLVFGLELNGAQELRPKKLALLYLRSWFLMDLVLISIDATILILEIFEESVPSSARLFRVMRLLRLLRLLRLMRLQNKVMVLANRLLSTNAFLILKVAGGLCMMMITNHIIACCWFGVGSFDAEKNWIKNMELDKEDFADSYSAALHWSLTQFTPATNNIVPDNAVERAFASAVILLAIGVFSSFIASISSSLNTLRMSRLENSKHYSKLFQFFNERNLSVNLYAKVKEVLRNENLAVRVQEKDVTFIQKIPERLKIQLHAEMYLPSLLSMKIWPHSGIDDADFFYSNMCHRVLCEGLASPGQDVFLPGTDCKDVYLLESGDMTYVMRRDTEATRICDQQLCVACLWAEWHHRGRLSAGQGMCYFIKVNCDAFGQVVLKYGGPLYRYLQIYGILLVSEIEWLQEDGFLMSDLNLDEEQMTNLSAQAERFANLVAVAPSPTAPKENALTRILSGMKSNPSISIGERV